MVLKKWTTIVSHMNNLLNERMKRETEERVREREREKQQK